MLLIHNSRKKIHTFFFGYFLQKIVSNEQGCFCVQEYFKAKLVGTLQKIVMSKVDFVCKNASKQSL